ncbi:MAG: AAA family ATPase [Proteobacteria bacterium]|nr:AAA family ATPase [Pseudomonadota bacterium]
MGFIRNRSDLQRIVILNPKGGCGKTSLATNLASCFSLRGEVPTLMDCDSQGASMRWLEKRSKKRPSVYGIAAYRQSLNVTRTWQQRVPSESRHVIVDTPAGMEASQIHELIYDASNVIIPVLPSPIDIRYAARFIAELLLIAQLDRHEVRVGIVANRTRKNTRSLHQLMRFLSSLKIPLVAVLRDSQCFVTAAGLGIGVVELPDHQGRRDRVALSRLVGWLDQRGTSQSIASVVPVVTDTDEFHVGPFH